MSLHFWVYTSFTFNLKFENCSLPTLYLHVLFYVYEGDELFMDESINAVFYARNMIYFSELKHKFYFVNIKFNCIKKFSG